MSLQPLRLAWRRFRALRDTVCSAARRRRFDAARPSVVRRFHELYYQGSDYGITWGDTRWLNTAVQKCPLDLWLYQELLTETRPDLIVETGTFMGGSALFLASVCDLLGHGRVVTVDLNPREGRPEHPRITYLTGSSTADLAVSKIRGMAQDAARVMVILDSAHQRAHVAEELRLYSPLVTLGSYLVVEDTHLNGNPIRPDYGPGPRQAVEEFLRGNPSFCVDPVGAKFLMSFNPGGYLRRVA